MSLLSQNKYDERLAEKLKRIANKRGSDSPPAEELKHVEGAPSETPKGGMGGKEKKQEQ